MTDGPAQGLELAAKPKVITRRDFLKVGALTAAGLSLADCGGAWKVDGVGDDTFKDNPNYIQIRQAVQSYVDNPTGYQEAMKALPETIKKNFVQFKVDFKRQGGVMTSNVGEGLVLVVSNGVAVAVTARHLFEGKSNQGQLVPTRIEISQDQKADRGDKFESSGALPQFTVSALSEDMTGPELETSRVYVDMHAYEKNEGAAITQEDLCFVVFHVDKEDYKFLGNVTVDENPNTIPGEVVSIADGTGTEELEYGLPVEMTYVGDAGSKALRETKNLGDSQVGLNGPSFLGSSGQPLTDREGRLKFMLNGSLTDTEVKAALSFALLKEKYGVGLLDKAVEALVTGAKLIAYNELPDTSGNETALSSERGDGLQVAEGTIQSGDTLSGMADALWQKLHPGTSYSDSKSELGALAVQGGRYPSGLLVLNRPSLVDAGLLGVGNDVQAGDMVALGEREQVTDWLQKRSMSNPLVAESHTDVKDVQGNVYRYFVLHGDGLNSGVPMNELRGYVGDTPVVAFRDPQDGSGRGWEVYVPQKGKWIDARSLIDEVGGYFVAGNFADVFEGWARTLPNP